MTGVEHKISYFRIIAELALVNLLLLLGCGWQNMSFYHTAAFAGFVNALFAGYMLNKMHTYKIIIDPTHLTAFNFRFGKRLEKQVIRTADTFATYRYELVGRGVKQKKLKVYTDNALRMAFEPGLSGWSHDDLDRIVAELRGNGVPVTGDEK